MSNAQSENLLERGFSASLRGRVDEAAFFCDKVLSKEPSNIRARGLRGIVDAQMGRFAEAIAKLADVLRESPGFFEAWIWLSVSNSRIGAKDEALEAAVRAVVLKPEEGSALNNLGLCQLAVGSHREAAAAFMRATDLMPDSSEVALNLGTALDRIGHLAEARVHFARAVATVSGSPGSYVALGQALLMQDQLAAAQDCGEKAVSGDAELFGARRLLANVLIRLGRGRAAEEHCLKAIKLEPTNEIGYMMLATALESQGLNDEAAVNYRRAIELKPLQGLAYYYLAFGRHIALSDSETIRTMETLVRDQTLHRDEVKALHYGLGRIFEDAKDYERSMRHFDEANRIAYSQTNLRAPFSKERHLIEMAMLRDTFTKEVFAQRTGVGLDSGLPIFVVGMMRSGTTLMEQILSRHPLVGAAEEQRFWIDNAGHAFDSQTREIDEDRLLGLAAEYLAILQGIAPDSPHVTNKMPANSTVLGLIHLAFPNARIIHMVRNPVDTCFSIYATPNGARVGYAHHKENMAFAFEQHLKLMEHWREVLPADRLMDVVYEELVEDPERIARKVVGFCGLDWSDLCLSPERNERAITTPSNWQVRQPVYKTSVERWRNFEPWIPEFRAFLER